MADENDTSDKTEDPTQKRLSEAQERGDVVKSQEINTWFMIAGATLVMSTFSGWIGDGIAAPMRNLIAKSWMIQTDGPGLLVLARSLGYILIGVVGVPLLMLVLTAIASNTSTIALGTAVIAAPLEDPRRLAEDAATVDVLAGGRLRLGLGVGSSANAAAAIWMP